MIGRVVKIVRIPYYALFTYAELAKSMILDYHCRTIIINSKLTIIGRLWKS